jgi:hypothetical protein
MINNNPAKTIYIDPPSPAYYEDKLFDLSNFVLNRDGTLVPFARVREAYRAKGSEVRTADYLVTGDASLGVSDYYSLGVLDNYKTLQKRAHVRLKTFVIFEPPVVEPRIYKGLPELTKYFERVYVHNTVGDGYSLNGVDTSKLYQLYWPQPHKDVLIDFWSREERLCRIVMINGNHRPVSYDSELYSKRIEVLSALAAFDTVDLYGRGWEKWWSRSSMWLPYWWHRRKLMSIYKGACISKHEVLSQYSFALCFENMAMKGYITEKIFDCLYAGTIPLYLGAKDIADLIPEDAYIDCRKFSSWKEMHEKVLGMSSEEIRSMRVAGRAFLQSEQGSRYYDSLITIFN